MIALGAEDGEFGEGIMKKARALVILVSVCFWSGLGFAALSPAGTGRSTGQAPRITLKPDLVIGAAEGNENYVLGAVSRIDLDAAGNIYVLDYKDRLIRIFKNDGSFLRKISVPAGQGPKEATSLSGIAVTPKGTLYVNDTRKVIVYGADGNFVRSFLVDFMISSIGCPGTEELVAIGPHAGKILHVFDESGKLLESFGEPFAVPAELEAMKDMPMFSAPLLFDSGKDGRIFVLNPHKYEVSVFKGRRLEQTLKGENPLFSPIKKMGRVFLSTAANIVGSNGRVFVALHVLDPRRQKRMDVFENGKQVDTLDVKGTPHIADPQGRIYFAEEGDFVKVVRYSVIVR
jgi:hypothetical protein